jgi:hypothetical protein
MKSYTTITHNGIELELVGTYVGEEQGTYYDQDGSGTPYSPATFDVEEITLIDSNINILSLFGFEDLEEIESKAVNNFNN